MMKLVKLQEEGRIPEEVTLADMTEYLLEHLPLPKVSRWAGRRHQATIRLSCRDEMMSMSLQIRLLLFKPETMLIIRCAT